ncbi:MAG: hypothetical protein IPM64_02480 [Phycisphaerales bacterium]|nr:hypothetical protein [Phycisphaerales bacterium]
MTRTVPSRDIGTLLALLLTAPPLWAGTFDSGSDGSDGALAPPAGPLVIDLAAAAIGPPGSGNGYFDESEWAVIFNYTNVTLASGTTITFLPHPSNAPVIWLVQGNVTIPFTASVSVSGGIGESAGSTERTTAAGGPGGFHGGFGGALTSTRWPSGGYGPGGPNVDPDSFGGGSGGSHATLGVVGSSSSGVTLGPTYGNMFCLPLIGGSGGAGGWGQSNLFGGGGGGGGGAILIAASGTIMINGDILARGGSGGFATNSGQRGGGGAGGAIRLIANTITGTGSLQADGSTSYAQAGAGRIRVEADSINLTAPGTPPFTSGSPGLVFPPATRPLLRVTSIGSQAAPANPEASPNSADVLISSEVAQTVEIEATNIPLGTIVQVRITPKRSANGFIVNSSPLAGTLGLSTASASVVFPSGLSDVQLSASFSPIALAPPRPGFGDLRVADAVREGRLSPLAVRADAVRGARAHEVVAVETGPRDGELTYITRAGHRAAYPAGAFAHVAALRAVRNAAD